MDMARNCRTCYASTTSVRSLKDAEPNSRLTFAEKLKACVPEIKLKMMTNSDVICWKCAAILEQFFEFREKCIETNCHFEKVESPISIMDSDEEADDLNKLLDEALGSGVTIRRTSMQNNGKVMQDDETTKRVKNRESPLNTVQQSTKRMKSDTVAVREPTSVIINGFGDNWLSKSEIASTSKDPASGLNNIAIANVTSLATVSNVEAAAEVFYCSLSYETFPTQLAVHLHRAMHREDQYFVCTMCNFKCELVGDLKTHVSKEHRPPLTEKPVWLYRCKTCNATFESRAACKEHQRSHFKPTEVPLQVNIKTDEIDIEEHEVASKAKPVKGTVNCRFCPKTLTTTAGMHHHEKKHVKGKNYCCLICDFTCTKGDTLKAHYKKHPVLRKQAEGGNRLVNVLPSQYKCDECEETFAHQSKLTIHKLTHKQLPVRGKPARRTM